jgi:hypothetical protein
MLLATLHQPTAPKKASHQLFTDDDLAYRTNRLPVAPAAKDFPPFSTVQGYFYDWRDQGLFERINFELLLQAREAAGRPPPASRVRTVERGRLPRTRARPVISKRAGLFEYMVARAVRQN